MKIQDRLSAHAQILRGGAAFFADEHGVTRAEWRLFAERQKINQHLPGIQGIGFALLIRRQHLAQHLLEVRAEGFPAYQVRPEGERETYSSIVYLEPFADRNLRAFGYDMLSEPVRRAAMERARDQDEAALSGRVILVQETREEIQTGSLMYVPVYRMGMPIETVEQRRAALFGWVYSPYRMKDLMQGILGGWDLAVEKRIHLEIFDSDKVASENLLFDSQSGESQPKGAASGMSLQSGVNLAGRPWSLRFTRTGSRTSEVDYGKVWLVAGGGSVASLLLSGLFFNLLNTRWHAWIMAKRLTADLQEAQAIGNMGSFSFDVASNCHTTSPHLDKLFGFASEQERTATAWTELLHPDDRNAMEAAVAACLERGVPYDRDYRIIRRSDGQTRWLRGIAKAELDASGKVKASRRTMPKRRSGFARRLNRVTPMHNTTSA